MAKKKRRRSYRRKSKKKGYSKPKAKPAGLAGGAALTGFDMLTSKSQDGTISILDALTYPYANLGDRLNAISTKVKYQATDLDNYKYALAGVLITASPRIPVIGILAKPVDRGMKRLTKGKWGL